MLKREEYRPEDHDDSKTWERHNCREFMSIFPVIDDENQLLYSACMIYAASPFHQPHLWNKLIYHDDESNGSDEASQERPAEYIIQKAETRYSSD